MNHLVIKQSKRSVGAILLLVLSVTLFSGCAAVHEAHSKLQSDHGHADSTAPAETQDWAKQRLAKSPRHQEWVKIKYKPANATTEREVNAFLVYPEVKTKATAIVVVHEIFGMSDWVQSLADQLAEAGYIAIAPDLLSGMGPNKGGTSDVATGGSNAIGIAIRALPPDQITADLNAVADYVASLPSANSKLAVAGFCWGGGETFRFATNRPSLKAAFVFYGPTPMTGPQGNQVIDKAALARVGAPVYGFYAENDMRINATLPATIEAMKQLNKKFEPVTYAGAGHGFMRAGEDPNDKNPANKKARDDAWKRWREILAKI
ncbi:MAG: carboxymethylenebutenolidase [Pyrinomonadaceae bacterium]|jgi:carboxymethylenebutenolidase|nr:carboxymethylenebutenolidase [Pyrinomonadaceae bacterium]